MTRKITSPVLTLIFAAALTFGGCAPSGGEAEFVPSDDQSAEELAEEEEYAKAMEANEAEQAAQR